MGQFYKNISKIQKVLAEIEERYVDLVCMFPLNVTHAELEYHIVTLKNVNLADRTTFLLEAMQDYWNFSTNSPGSKYSYELWKEMLAHAYRAGDPPTCNL